MKLFHTRPAANQGIKVPLSAPDGSTTEYFLQILGVDSDRFRQKKADTNRNALLQEALAKGAEAGGSDAQAVKATTDAFYQDQKLALLASLVVGWNFTDEDGSEMPCTEEKVKAFFKDAPQIADKVDQLAANRAYFLAECSKSSMNGQPVNLP